MTETTNPYPDEPLTLANGVDVVESWSWLIDGLARPKQEDGETSAAWTDRCILAGAKADKNRQCSIGWHDECSDPDGESCACPCHKDAATVPRLVEFVAWARVLLRHLAEAEERDRG